MDNLHNVTAENYIEAAVSFGSNTCNSDAVSWPFAAHVLVKFVENGEQLDWIKRAIFYGKSVGEADSEFVPLTVAMNDVKNLDRVGRENLFHAVLGVATEAGELVEALLVGLRNGKVDIPNVLEEFGDILWYMALGLNTLGYPFDHVMRMNIRKLSLRYPEKFSPQRATERNLDAERELIERATSLDDRKG